MQRRRNPVKREWAAGLPPAAVAFLDALEAAYTGLVETADKLRESGYETLAEPLEVEAERLMELTENAAGELLAEAGDLDVQGDEAQPSIEEELALLWHDWLLQKAGKAYPRFSSEQELLDTVDHVFGNHRIDSRPYPPEQKLAALEEAYEIVRRRRRIR